MTSLPHGIKTKLARFELRRKVVASARGFGECVLVLGASVVLVALIEWVWKPPLGARILLSGGACFCGACFLFGRAFLPLVQCVPLARVAERFETAAHGHFKDRILSAVQMAESQATAPLPGVSPWMVKRTIDLAAEDLSAVDPVTLVDAGPATQALRRAAYLILALGLGALVPGFRSRAWLALNPYAPTSAFSNTRLVVEPGNCHIKLGAPIEVRATTDPVVDQAKLLINWADGFRESVSMSREATNGFSARLPAVSQSFHYLVQAADAESDRFQVQVDQPPRIARLQLRIEPPAYTGWTNRVVEGGSADFLEGSRVQLTIETAGEAVAGVDWAPEGLPPQALRPLNNRWILDLQPSQIISYQLRLADATPLPPDQAQKWTLRPAPDEPPMARLEAPGTESGLVQRDELLPLLAVASDDVGLKRVQLIVLRHESEAEVRTLLPAKTANPRPNQPADREFHAPVNYSLAGLGLLTGDEVRFQLVATDLKDQTTRSEPLSVTVGSFEKTLEARLAERLQEMVSALDGQLEYLRQTRTSWLSISRNYREDDASDQGPALTLLRSRLDEFALEIGSVGQRLVHESQTNLVEEARLMYRLGTTLSTWGHQQDQVLLRHLALLNQARGSRVAVTFDQGRELFSRAVMDLEEYRRVVALLQGSFETDVLQTRCEGAQGRYRRGLAILRGASNVVAPLASTGSGLLATFFDGTDLKGNTLEQKIDNPRFDNYAPASHRDQWSCRYEGDIQIPASGDWTLACIADDGVRLILESKPVLPDSAWSAHPATQFAANLNLTSGWHPLTIEFFQGSGESKLRLLAAKKGDPVQEVPLAWLRPPAARHPEALALPNDPSLSAFVKDSLKDRLKASLSLPASVPTTLVPLTNLVNNETLTRLVSEKLSVGQTLARNLTNFAAWTTPDSQQAESQADDLVALSKDAHRIVREELDRFRWRYEGSAALKEVQNAIQELRAIDQDIRHQPWHSSKKLTEEEQAKITLAKTWQNELVRATASAAHQFFDTAKQQQATLAERTIALAATSKAQRELQPAVEKLAKTLGEHLDKEDMLNQVDGRLNEISDRYRELNDLQERINREQVAALARQALPPARAFARSQKNPDSDDLAPKYDSMEKGVAPVVEAERAIGDYAGATKLETLAGHSPQDAKGKETALELRDLAQRTDQNPPSLAQAIPPPMQEETVALDQRQTTPEAAADTLAQPRLGMALEAERLRRQRDPRTAVAYEFLGEDTAKLIDSPPHLNATTLQPLADRAAVLAGQKGDDARQAEIASAMERLKQLARQSPDDPSVLAHRLEDLSDLAGLAAGDASKRPPLTDELGEMSHLAPHVSDWADSTSPPVIAASASHESLEDINAAPKQGESYHDASRILADAAHQLRMDNAVRELADLNPFPVTVPATDELDDSAHASAIESAGKLEGPAGIAARALPPQGLDQAEWARLNARLRQALQSSGIEHFTAEQQAAIRSYFERLGSANDKPNNHN